MDVTRHWDATNSVRLCDRCEAEQGISAGADKGDTACAACGAHEANHVYPAIDRGAVEALRDLMRAAKPWLEPTGAHANPAMHAARQTLDRFGAALAVGDIEHSERCGGRIQWHPRSEDFGVCAECGYEAVREQPFDVLRQQLDGVLASQLEGAVEAINCALAELNGVDPADKYERECLESAVRVLSNVLVGGAVAVDAHDCIAVIDRMIAETVSVANKIAVEFPEGERLNSLTSMGIRLQVLGDVKRHLTVAAIKELEAERESGTLGS